MKASRRAKRATPRRISGDAMNEELRGEEGEGRVEVLEFKNWNCPN